MQDYSERLKTRKGMYTYKGNTYSMIGVFKLGNEEVVKCCVCKKVYKAGDYLYHCREKGKFFCDNDKCHAEHNYLSGKEHSDQFIMVE